MDASPVAPRRCRFHVFTSSAGRTSSTNGSGLIKSRLYKAASDERDGLSKRQVQGHLPRLQRSRGEIHGTGFRLARELAGSPKIITEKANARLLCDQNDRRADVAPCHGLASRLELRLRLPEIGRLELS